MKDGATSIRGPRHFKHWSETEYISNQIQNA